jgi:hypothetical protein
MKMHCRVSTQCFNAGRKTCHPLYQGPSVRAENAAFYADFDLKVAEEAGRYSMLETPVLVASRIAPLQWGG